MGRGKLREGRDAVSHTLETAKPAMAGNIRCRVFFLSFSLFLFLLTFSAKAVVRSSVIDVQHCAVLCTPYLTILEKSECATPSTSHLVPGIG